MREIKIDATDENLDRVIEFVEEQLDILDCPIKSKIQINIAVEELFINIAHYAYSPNVGAVTVQVTVSLDPPAAEITFIDNGKPYNPLSKSDPDITLSAEQRQIGGLGIYMAKKTMDDLQYSYKNGSNILTIRKNLN